MAYLLDADVLIRAKNLHYGFDFCPAFWGWLVKQNAAGTVKSVEKVGDELFGMDDSLSAWARERGEGFFTKPGSPSLDSLGKVAEWASSQTYALSAVEGLLARADYYLVAQAHANGDTVVTHEAPSNSVNKIKIPDVCIGMKVKCLTPFQMLRMEGARLVLG